MLSVTPRLKLGVLVAAAAGVVLTVGAGQAAAAKLVTSDAISWKGTYSPASGLITVTSCKLKSDGETPVFPCAVTAVLRSGPALETKWTSVPYSLDGEGFSTGPIPLALVKSVPPVETYEGTGQCYEVEENDLPGTTGPVRYPCVAKVRLIFNTAKGTVSGSYRILEEATQP